MNKWRFVALFVPLLALMCAAQDVPPPPRPADAPPSIDTLARSLQEKLSSIGRLSWSETRRNTRTNKVTGPAQAWEGMSRVTIHPSTCEMRLAWETSWAGDVGGTFFFEEMDNPVVLTSEEFMNRTHPGFQYTMSPMPYSVGTSTGDFKVRDQQTANQIADALRQLGRQCKAIPIPPPSANSGPSLADTLHFIEGKLDDNGALDFHGTNYNPDGSPSGGPISVSMTLTQAAADPSTCLLRFHYRVTVNGDVMPDRQEIISFRRVEKLEVAEYQDYVNGERTRHPQGGQTKTYKTDRAVYLLLVTYPGGRKVGFELGDQEIANRIAKAMNHALELCGGGRPEPF